jgi:hypothetical protein
MLKPALVDLTAYIGGTYDTKIEFWADVKHETPYDLSPYDISLMIEGGPTLTESSGLVVSGNKISVLLTPTQTATAAKLSRAHYWLKFVNGEEVLYPINGTLSFEAP